MLLFALVEARRTHWPPGARSSIAEDVDRRHPAGLRGDVVTQRSLMFTVHPMTEAVSIGGRADVLTRRSLLAAFWRFDAGRGGSQVALRRDCGVGLRS